MTRRRPGGVHLVSRAALALACLALVAAAASGDAALSRQAADSLQRKVLDIRQYAQAPLNGSRLTSVSESELNSYLRYELGAQMPPGVTEPYVDIVGDGRIAGRAVVDLDAVRQSRKRGGWLDPTNLLTGRLPVAATGTLRTEEGRAWLDLESAEVGGVPIPKAFLQELVTYYSRSPEYPNGVDLDAPFPLPARIKEIHVRPRQAVVVQR